MKSFGKQGTVVASAPVWNGAQSEINLVLKDRVGALVPVLGNLNTRFEVEYKSPIPAPIVQGQELATLIVSNEGLADVKVPLVAETAIQVGGFITRVLTAAKSIIRIMILGPEVAL